MRSKVADTLRDQQRLENSALTVDERLKLMLELGEQQLQLYMSINNLSRDEAMPNRPAGSLHARWKRSSMNLARSARAILEARGTPHILIGAAAIGVYGVLRSTKDTDFLTVDKSILDPLVWIQMEEDGAKVNVYKGDFGDPLAGTVRIVRNEEQVDVVVGKYKWEKAVIDRADEHVVEGAPLRIPRAADLVLLKMSAGGPKDAWDIHELMNYIDRTAVITEIDSLLETLPDPMQKLWRKLRAEISTATSG
jgi:predicted nucleotidyltransferase